MYLSRWSTSCSARTARRGQVGRQGAFRRAPRAGGALQRPRRRRPVEHGEGGVEVHGPARGGELGHLRVEHRGLEVHLDRRPSADPVVDEHRHAGSRRPDEVDGRGDGLEARAEAPPQAGLQVGARALGHPIPRTELRWTVTAPRPGCAPDPVRDRRRGGQNSSMSPSDRAHASSGGALVSVTARQVSTGPCPGSGSSPSRSVPSRST